MDRIGTIVQNVPMLFDASNRPTWEAGKAFFRRTGGAVVDTASTLLQA